MPVVPGAHCMGPACCHNAGTGNSTGLQVEHLLRVWVFGWRHMFTFFHMLDLVLVIVSFALALTIQLLSTVSIELEQVRECTCAWNTLYILRCSPLY